MSIFWAYLQLRALLWLLRMTGRLLLWAAVLAGLVAAAPITLVAVVGLVGAWLRGWPPARLRRAAAWALPMTGVYLAGRAVQTRTWEAFALAPVHDYLAAWHAASSGQVVTAFVLVAPVAVPAGLAAAAGLWAWRIYALETGLAGKTASAPVIFDARQWKRQARTARARITAPGAMPLADTRGQIVMGATIRAVGHRWRPVLAVPYAAMGRHQVVLGASGSGKTNLMNPHLGRLVLRRPDRPPQARRTAPAAGGPGLQGRPGLPGQGRPDPPPAARRGRRSGGGLAG